MSMGETGMAEMSEMAEMMPMPLPENTLPMMTGKGQFGALDMGGMFTTLKVRKELAKNDYTDPGDYQFPKETLAYEWTGKLPEANTAPFQVSTKKDEKVILKVKKPGDSAHHGH